MGTTYPHTVNPWDNKRGQATIMVTLVTALLSGILGLVVDVGYAYFIKQMAQAAVDSAVLAGVTMAKDSRGVCGSGGVLCQKGTTCSATPTNPPATNFDSACLYAQANGFPSSGSQTVTVSGGSGNPANVGVASSYWMTATASQTLPLSFLRVVGFNSNTVSASATAALTGSISGGCIYVLDPNGSASYNQAGTSTVQSDCGIYVDSSASDAFTVKGNALVDASVINVVGGTKINNNASVTPNPTNGISPASDPFSSLPAPTYGGCDYTGMSFNGGTYNLTPGVYCQGIKVSGNAVLNLSPGTYILNGGGMQVTSSFATLNGSGVFFYNTSDGFAFAPVTIAGNATVNLSAPTSGTYQGILLFQDRAITSSANSAIGGGSNQTLSGTIYLPTATLNFAGGSATNSLTMALVVADIDIVGNAYLKKDTTGTATGLISNRASLVQ
jgi:hypothetical protein